MIYDHSKPHNLDDEQLYEVYSGGDRGHDDAGSEVDLTLSNASLRPLADLPEPRASAQAPVWRSKPRDQRYRGQAAGGMSAASLSKVSGSICRGTLHRRARRDPPMIHAAVVPELPAALIGSMPAPFTMRLHCLRGAPIDDGFHRRRRELVARLATQGPRLQVA